MLLQVPREVCRLSEEPSCHIIHKLLPQLKEHKTCNKVKIYVAATYLLNILKVPRIVCKEETDCKYDQEKP